jgi:hypothetical protein
MDADAISQDRTDGKYRLKADIELHPRKPAQRHPQEPDQVLTAR